MDLGAGYCYYAGSAAGSVLVTHTRIAWLHLWYLLLAVRRIPSDKKGGRAHLIQAGDIACLPGIGETFSVDHHVATGDGGCVCLSCLRVGIIFSHRHADW